MTAQLKEVVTSWGFVFVAGAVLWPPRAVYWEDVAVYVGETLTLGSVGLLAVSLGAAFVWGTRVRLQSFVVGAVIAYGSGMLAIEVVSTPESPVHLIWYGGLLCCFVSGALLWRFHAGQISVSRLLTGR